MGIDEGFDLYPPLTESEVDKEKWAAFLAEVKKKYENEFDHTMTIDKEGGIEFAVGEHPHLLKDGHRFRRFSAKVSGRLCGNVEKYLHEVESIARRHFPGRIYHWNDCRENWLDQVRYDWKEVYDAAKAVPV